MPDSDRLSSLGSLKDVEHFIVADPSGNLIGHDIENPELMAKIIARCGRNLHHLGKTNFKYARFDQKDSRHFLIFPVGKYYLGVIKHKNIKTDTLIETIKKHLAEPVRGHKR